MANKRIIQSITGEKTDFDGERYEINPPVAKIEKNGIVRDANRERNEEER